MDNTHGANRPVHCIDADPVNKTMFQIPCPRSQTASTAQALADTITDFAKLAETTLDKSIVVWINEFFGRVKHESMEGWEG